jgi:hypothetical protein
MVAADRRTSGPADVSDSTYQINAVQFFCRSQCVNSILPVRSLLPVNTLPRVFRATLIAAVLAVVSALLQAQTYPLRPVKIVVPFPPGGSSDAVARVLGERLSEEWKQPVLIENRPGAGTTIAGAHVAAAPADGHTLFLQGVATYATTGSLYRNLAFDPLKGFAPVSMLSISPFILVTRNGLGVNSARELAELARSKPGALSYGSSGSGGSPHLFGDGCALWRCGFSGGRCGGDAAGACRQAQGAGGQHRASDHARGRHSHHG